MVTMVWSVGDSPDGRQELHADWNRDAAQRPISTDSQTALVTA